LFFSPLELKAITDRAQRFVVLLAAFAVSYLEKQEATRAIEHVALALIAAFHH